jgi:CRISPR-associated protein Cas2
VVVLVAYDVNTETKEGQRRLRHVAKICENFGQRVQKSLFECLVDWAKWTAVKQQLIDTIDTKLDSLRFYFLGNNWHGRIEHVGAKASYDPEGPMII